MHFTYYHLQKWPNKIKETLIDAKKNSKITEKNLLDGLKRGKEEIKLLIKKLNDKFEEVILYDKL